MLNTEEILGNVVWLVNVLDDEALEEVQDVPLLELAKVVTTLPLPEGCTPAGSLQKRVRPRYPTTGRKVLMKSLTAGNTH